MMMMMMLMIYCAQCPYCLLNFTVYSKMEELEEDTVYFAVKSNLTQRLEIDLKKNSMRNDYRWYEISIINYTGSR